MANILILGGGFAGLVAAEKLANEIRRDHDITLVSRGREFTFYPALVQLAFGETEPSEVTFDLADKARSLGIRYVNGEALHINGQNKCVRVTGNDFNGEINYDYLIIAVGRRLATEKVRGLFEFSHHLLDLGAAMRFREAINGFTSGTALIGLCPDARQPVPVCETAFGLARRLKNEIATGEAAVKVVFPGSIKEAFGGADLHGKLTEAFEKHGIDVVTDFPITEITGRQVISSEGETLDYDLPMLVPPFRGQTIVGNLRVSSSAGVKMADSSAYARVDGHMRVPRLDGVYAVGDIVAFSGPKFAHMAVRQGEVAAKNIISELRGELPDEIYYHEIATVIDQGGADSIYLHYGIWDDHLFRLKQGRFWSWAKDLHDRFWTAVHG